MVAIQLYIAFAFLDLIINLVISISVHVIRTGLLPLLKRVHHVVRINFTKQMTKREKNKSKLIFEV